MFKQTRFLVGSTALIAAISLSLLSGATAQIDQQSVEVGQTTQSSPRPVQNNFQGRGVAQGSAFTRGRNVSTDLTIDRDNFGFELAEPPGRSDTGRARVQYRGSVVRRSSSSANFTLDGRIRSFNSSANLRVLPNTTGTCRIEVFDSRVISSTCRTATADSTTQFLGLEQF